MFFLVVCDIQNQFKVYKKLFEDYVGSFYFYIDNVSVRIVYYAIKHGVSTQA